MVMTTVRAYVHVLMRPHLLLLPPHLICMYNSGGLDTTGAAALARRRSSASQVLTLLALKKQVL